MTVTSLPPDPRFFFRLATLCEVAVLLAASFASGLWALQVSSPGLAETLGFVGGGETDFWASSLVMLKQFAAQYGVLVLLAWLFARLQGGRPLSAFGLSKGDKPLGVLMGMGLIAGLLVGLPIHSMFIARDLWSIGAGTPLWILADRVPWDLGFWVFFAVGSFVVVPLVEEFAWRGYALGRLTEGFGPGPAILVTTLFFSLLHVQYFVAIDLAKLLTIAGLVFGALVFGALTVRTGSLVPAIVAHVMINIPMITEVRMAFLGLGFLSILVFFRPIRTLASDTWRLMATRLTFIALLMLVGLGGAGYVLWQWGGYLALALLPGLLLPVSFFLRRQGQ